MGHGVPLSHSVYSLVQPGAKGKEGLCIKWRQRGNGERGTLAFALFTHCLRIFLVYCSSSCRI
jgi:hypothetical protein